MSGEQAENASAQNAENNSIVTIVWSLIIMLLALSGRPILLPLPTSLFAQTIHFA